MGVTGKEMVLDTLKKLYKRTLLPLEQFIAFPAPPLSDVDFDALPLVLVVGQYSTGKTTFIRHMLGRDFPSQRVGPEPTTDRFTGIVACDGATEGVVPGLVAIHDPAYPFGILDQLGDAFLSRFVVARTDAPLARRVVFIDTPGVSPRSSVVDVARCLARRVDKVVVMFDATKMVLCDDMRRLLEVFADYDEKLLFVLNKSDSLKYHQLMRVYGALMWSLSKVLRSPETRKVFIGSFWERPLHYDVCRSLLESEERDLLAQIENLPHSAAMRKLDAFVARAREVQVYAKAASVLRPRHFSAKRPGVDVAFSQLRRLLPHVPPADFPDLVALRRNRNIRKPRTGLLTALDAMLAHDVPNLVAEMQPSPYVATSMIHRWHHHDPGRERRSYDALFASLKPIAGKITGAAAKHEMIKSKLPNSCLRKIWKLADADKDGMLDITEFTMAMHLIELKVAGYELPYQYSVDVSCSTAQKHSGMRPRSAYASLTHTRSDGEGGTATKILDDVPERPERSLTIPSCLKPFDTYRRAQSYDEINVSSESVESELKDCGKNESQGTNSLNFDSSDTLSPTTSADSCLTLIEDDVKCRDDLPKSTAAESYKISENLVPVSGENTQDIFNTEITLVSIPNCTSTASECVEPDNCICKSDSPCSEALVSDDSPKNHDSTTYAESDLYQSLIEICQYRQDPIENSVDLKECNSGQLTAEETSHDILSSSNGLEPSFANDNLSFRSSATNERNEDTRDENTENVTCYKLHTSKLKTENQGSNSSRVMRSSSLKYGTGTYYFNNERSSFLDQCSSIHKSAAASDDCCEEREPFYDITNINDSGNMSEQCIVASDAIDSGGMKTGLRSRSAEVQSGNRDNNVEISPNLSPCCNDNIARVRFKQNESVCNCEDCSNYSKNLGSACSSDTNKCPQVAFQYDRRFTRKGEESAQTDDHECEVGLESRRSDCESSKCSKFTLGIQNNGIDVRLKKISGYQPIVKSGEELIGDTSHESYSYTVTDSKQERNDCPNKNSNGISWDIWPGSEPNLCIDATNFNPKSPLHQSKWWTEPRKPKSNLFSKYELPEYNHEKANTYITKYGHEDFDWSLTESNVVGDDHESEEGAGFSERCQLGKSNMTQFNRHTKNFESMNPRFGIMSDSQDDIRGFTTYWNERTSDIPLSVVCRQERESTRNHQSNAAIAMEPTTKIRDDNGGDLTSSTSERLSWSSEVSAAANRIRHPKRVMLSVTEENVVKNSDFHRFVDELTLSDTSDVSPYATSDLLHKSSRAGTTWMTPVRANSLGLTALSSPSPSRHSDGGELNLSYHKLREPTCWHEKRSPKESCGRSDADENGQRDNEELNSSREGGIGDTCEGNVCPERDFNDHNQYRPDGRQ